MVVWGRPESAQKIIKFGFGPVSSFLLILKLRFALIRITMKGPFQPVQLKFKGLSFKHLPKRRFQRVAL